MQTFTLPGPITTWNIHAKPIKKLKDKTQLLRLYCVPFSKLDWNFASLFPEMSVFDDSFVIVGDDASESVPVSASLDDSIDDVFAAPSSDYAAYSNGDGPILPPPSEMESDEGTALREWRRYVQFESLIMVRSDLSLNLTGSVSIKRIRVNWFNVRPCN